MADGTEQRIPAAELGLGYRESRFKAIPGASHGTAVVPGAGEPHEHPPFGPAEVVLGATFRLGPADPAVIRQRLDDIRRWRQAHQPLGIPSAGSVFRNPPDGPSAGAIVDALGLKGSTEGGATVSPKHANFIVNDRRGTAADVRRLAERVRAEVRRREGIELAFEIVFLGDWSDWPADASPTDRPG
jgi:UDP-N-acetylmuramate dehydrogenase